MRRCVLVIILSRCDDFALHIRRDRFAHVMQHRRRDIHDLRLQAAAAQIARRIVEDEHALLRVIGIVGAGVVLEGVDAVETERADRAPRQIAEVHDQIGRDVVDLRDKSLRA